MVLSSGKLARRIRYDPIGFAHYLQGLCVNVIMRVAETRWALSSSAYPPQDKMAAAARVVGT